MDSVMLVFELDRETQSLLSPNSSASQMITSAATMASFLHREQTRMVRGDLPRVPYIEHPLRVALRLLRWGVSDAETIAAALLHDVLEDCSEELIEVFGETGQEAEDWIGRQYGLRIASIVSDLTNPTDGTDYLDHLQEITYLPSLLIKASDLVDNAGSLAHQYGHVKDAFVTKRLAKYRPAVLAVWGALQSEVDLVAVNAARRLNSLGFELDALADRIEADKA
jgi:(p)ppGpp synthase/HD superfamily hydrolase